MIYFAWIVPVASSFSRVVFSRHFFRPGEENQEKKVINHGKLLSRDFSRVSMRSVKGIERTDCAEEERKIELRSELEKQ